MGAYKLSHGRHSHRTGERIARQVSGSAYWFGASLTEAMENNGYDYDDTPVAPTGGDGDSS
jgi:hypothetical protein